jgi:hypothetical protein
MKKYLIVVIRWIIGFGIIVPVVYYHPHLWWLYIVGGVLFCFSMYMAFLYNRPTEKMKSIVDKIESLQSGKDNNNEPSAN